MKRVHKDVLKAIAQKAIYPRICELGLEIKQVEGYDYVEWKPLRKALLKHKITKKYGEYYGCQTAYEHGPYAHDVEAVLERIASGTLKGTQKDWD
jgi:hypothetical protein